MWYLDFPYDLTREMARLQRDVNQLFGDEPTSERGYRTTFPPVNIWANDESAIVTCELPGFDPAAIEISVQDEVLQLSGRRSAKEMEQPLNPHRRERSMGEFRRSLRLPFPSDPDKVEAEFEKGVLRIKLPRAERDKPKKIEIKG